MKVRIDLNQLPLYTQISLYLHLKKKFEHWSWAKDPLIQQPLDMDLADLDFSVRSFSVLRRANKRTIRELTSMTREELLALPGCGKRIVWEIERVLEEIGLGLGG